MGIGAGGWQVVRWCGWFMLVALSGVGGLVDLDFALMVVMMSLVGGLLG